MKKFFAILLAVCMIAALAACGAPKTAEYKLGMGTVLKFTEGKAQNDTTVAAVVLDKDGKIVAARIDVAQNKMDVTDGQVDTAATFKTKLEKGDEYGMKGVSEHEWFEQAAAFEQYVIGKTGDEIKNMPTTVNESGHTVTTDETLYASCSISIAEFQEAIVKACNDEQGKSFQSDGSFKLGLAINSTADESEPATAEKDGTVKMYSEYAAVVLGTDGKILAAVTDAVQPQIKINTAGEIVEQNFSATKRELKEAYNMKSIMNTTYEWYEQAKNFTDYAVGKTAAELQGVETKVNDEGHTVFADEALYASVSISIDGMTAVLVKAVDNAR